MAEEITNPSEELISPIEETASPSDEMTGGGSVATETKPSVSKVDMLWNALSKDDVYKSKVGSIDEFRTKMQNPEKVKMLWNALSKDEVYASKVGDEKTFLSKVSSPKSPAPSTKGGQSGAVKTPSTSTSVLEDLESGSWTETANPLDSKFQNFKKTLPSNLKNTDESTYNLRGYWEGLGKPDKFDYSQKKEADGTYHASSRNPKTGEILKKRNHPTFNQALEEDAKMGYMPYISPNGTVYTFSKEDKIPSGFKPYKPTAKPVIEVPKSVKQVEEVKPITSKDFQIKQGAIPDFTTERVDRSEKGFNKSLFDNYNSSFEKYKSISDATSFHKKNIIQSSKSSKGVLDGFEEFISPQKAKIAEEYRRKELESRLSSDPLMQKFNSESKKAKSRFDYYTKLATEEIDRQLDAIANKNGGWGKFVKPLGEADVDKVRNAVDDFLVNNDISPDSPIAYKMRNEMKAKAEFKKIEPQVNTEFEINYKKKYGVTPDEDLQKEYGLKANEITGIKQAKDELEKRRALESQSLKAEFQPQINAYDEEYKTKLNALNSKVESDPELNNYANSLYKENFSKYQSLVNQGAITVEQAKQEMNSPQNLESINAKVIEKANEKYGKDFEAELTTYQKQLNELNSRYNSIYRRQESARLEQANKKIESELNKFKGSFKPSKEILERREKAYSDAYNIVGGKYSKAQENVTRELGHLRQTQALLSGLGGGLKSYGQYFDNKFLYDMGESIEANNLLKIPESKNFSDWLDVDKLVVGTGNIIGRMIPMIGVSAATGFITRNWSTTAQMATIGLTGWVAEGADMTGAIKGEVLEKTGDPVKADEAVKSMWQSHVYSMPLYAFSGLPFVNGLPTKIAKKIAPSLFKEVGKGARRTFGQYLKQTAAAAAVSSIGEMAEEIPQEFKQGIDEEAIRNGAEIKNISDQLRILKEGASWERFSETVVQVAPSTIVMGSVPVFFSESKNYAKEKYYERSVDNYINGLSISEALETSPEQYIYNTLRDKGKNFTGTLINTLYTSGNIDEQTYDKLADKLQGMDNFQNFLVKNKLEFTKTENIIGYKLHEQYQQAKKDLEDSTDELGKDILKDRARKAKDDFESFYKGEGVNAAVLTMGDGTQYVFSSDEISSLLQFENIRNDIRNKNISVSVLSKLGKESDMQSVVDEMEKIQQEKPLEEEKPATAEGEVVLTKNTSPTSEKYGTINRNDGKGVVDLTKEEYEAEQAKMQPKAEGTAPVEEPLKDRESMVKALMGTSENNPRTAKVTELQNNYILGDSGFANLPSSEEYNKRVSEIYNDKNLSKEDAEIKYDEEYEKLNKARADYIYDLYDKAKKDGSNPELVKAVEELLTPKTTTNEKANEDGEQKRGKDGEEDVTKSLQSEGEDGGKQVDLKEKQVLAPEGAVTAAPNVEAGSVGVVEVEFKVGDKVVDADGVEYEVLELSTSRKGVPQAVVKLPNRTEEQLQETARVNVFGRNENRLLYESPNDPKFLKEQSIPIAQELSDQRAINNSISSTTLDLADLKQSLKETPQAGSAVGGEVKNYKGIFNPKKTGISGLDDLLEDDGYNYFYKSVGGEVVMMSPDEYLKRVREGLKTKEDANVTEDKKDAINKAINEGNKINMPFISEKDGKFSQEGRNRAVVARERGEKLIPVFIEKDVSFDDKIAKGQEYINSAIKDGATAKEEVLSKLKEQGLHRDAIRFIDNNFDDKAVKQSLKETPQAGSVGVGGEVEATAKALEGVDKNKLPLLRDVATNIQNEFEAFKKEKARLLDEKNNLDREAKDAIIKKTRYKKSEKYPDKYEFNTGASITRKTEQQLIDDYYDAKIKKIQKDEPKQGVLDIYRKQDREFSSPQKIAEAYHKAKADGSNPELVEAVEQLLGKPKEETPQAGIVVGGEKTKKLKSDDYSSMKPSDVMESLKGVPELSEYMDTAIKLQSEIDRISDIAGGVPEEMPTLFPYRLVVDFITSNKKTKEKQDKALLDFKSQIESVKSYLKSKPTDSELMSLKEERQKTKEEKEKDIRLKQEESKNNVERINKIEQDEAGFIKAIDSSESRFIAMLLNSGVSKQSIVALNDVRNAFEEVDGISISLSKMNNIFSKYKYSKKNLIDALENKQANIFTSKNLQKLKEILLSQEDKANVSRIEGIVDKLMEDYENLPKSLQQELDVYIEQNKLYGDVLPIQQRDGWMIKWFGGLKRFNAVKAVEQSLKETTKAEEKVSGGLTQEEKVNLENISKDAGVNFQEVRNVYNKYGDGKPLNEITLEDYQKAEEKRQKQQSTKTTEDAVQKQAAGQVPIQPKAGVGEEVEGGKSQTKSEKATKESQKEIDNLFDLYDTIDESKGLDKRKAADDFRNMQQSIKNPTLKRIFDNISDIHSQLEKQGLITKTKGCP